MNETAVHVLERIGMAGIVPVLILESSGATQLLGETLMAGGLPVAEVTFRSESALKSIEVLRERFPDMLVGAGTVLNVDQVQEAHDAGSQFIVTPGFNSAVVEASLELGMPILPGINNPTGVEQAMSFGLDAVKFFPAEASGGPSFLKALAGPYPAMRFLPSGGITPNNLLNYLTLPNVIACSGSWITDSALVKAGEFREIKRLANEAVNMASSKNIENVG